MHLKIIKQFEMNVGSYASTKWPIYILQMIFPNLFSDFFKENFCRLIQISLQFFHEGPIRHQLNHYLNQCWPSFMLQLGVTRPQWVNKLSFSAPLEVMERPCDGPVLLVGEGDFSLTVALTKYLSNVPITTSSLLKQEEIQHHQDAEKHLQTLQEKGEKLMD